MGTPDLVTLFCPKCGHRFEHRIGQAKAVFGLGGAASGAALGSKIGLAMGPLGAIAGTIPGALVGALLGNKVGTKWGEAECPECGTTFALSNYSADSDVALPVADLPRPGVASCVLYLRLQIIQTQLKLPQIFADGYWPAGYLNGFAFGCGVAMGLAPDPIAMHAYIKACMTNLALNNRYRGNTDVLGRWNDNPDFRAAFEVGKNDATQLTQKVNECGGWEEYKGTQGRWFPRGLTNWVETTTGIAVNWADWLSRFKIEAGKYHTKLKCDASGHSLVDFMDHAPLKAAWRDRLRPEAVGRKFGMDFDFNKFGRQ